MAANADARAMLERLIVHQEQALKAVDDELATDCCRDITVRRNRAASSMSCSNVTPLPHVCVRRVARGEVLAAALESARAVHDG